MDRDPKVIRLTAASGLVLLLGCCSTSNETSPAKGPPMYSTPTPVTSTQTPTASPYQLASKALDAYRSKNLDAWSALLAQPLAAGSTADQVFTQALEATDKIQGLYIQRDTGHFAAVVRTAAAGAPALWFDLVRAPGGGFFVERVVSADKNPAMDMPVEG